MVRLRPSPIRSNYSYIQKGDVAPEEKLHSKEALPSFSLRFLGLPYTWGGKSSFGYDSSGFVQMLYNQIGIQLPRDSKDQAKDPRFITLQASELQPGDLIFFGKTEQRINHVGMYLGEGRFIHPVITECKPWVRVSSLNDPDWSGRPDSLCPYRLCKQLVP